MAHDADVIVVGAGLSGLVATAELVRRGRKVILLDQEPRASLGGQAYWSFGGLFFVDSPEQRRLHVADSVDLALRDWFGSASFDQDTDFWPRQWAQAYVHFASGEKRAWLHELGMRWFPLVQWSERGGYLADGHGNSVPRFHITWGTGPAVIEPFIREVLEAAQKGSVKFKFRHQVTKLTVSNGVVDGVRGAILAASAAQRGQPSSRSSVGEFELRAQAVIVTSGGIGGDHDTVRRNWPERLGALPQTMLAGVPDYVDGSMLQTVRSAGGQVVNADRMWHYPEGIPHHTPLWTNHGVRILPGPSSLWLTATGQRLPTPLFPGFDSLGALAHIGKTGYSYSWFVLNKRILGKEFALSGSEHNPDLTQRQSKQVIRRALPGAVAPIEEFAKLSPEFIFGSSVAELAAGMNALTGTGLINAEKLTRVITDRDRQISSKLGKDMQINAIRAARRFISDRLVRVVPPHRLLDPSAGPLAAVRLSILTRKTLGGLLTDLSARVLQSDGSVLPGVYAAGEAAGFGGGGMHGYRALEGTFLGGCLFSGRIAGRAAAEAVS